MSGTYRVYALRCGSKTPSDPRLFLQSDQTRAKMDYFVWAAVDEASQEAIVVDTGFATAVGKSRGREYLASPAALLGCIAVDAGAVRKVILTHLHDDHTGHLGEFPGASFYLQEEEMRFWTGPLAHRGFFRNYVRSEDLRQLVTLNLDGRIAHVSGRASVAPGIEVHLVGGHTPGLQVVTVRTRAGTVVLAGDAAHYRVELEQDLVFGVVCDVAGSYAALSTVQRLTDKAQLIVPGHDPAVMAEYPQVTDSVVRIA